MRLKTIGAVAACLSLTIAALIPAAADQGSSQPAGSLADMAPTSLQAQSTSAAALPANAYGLASPLSGEDAKLTPQQRQLAAAMLLRQAQGMFYAPDQTPQRAARLVTLTAYALRFKNDDPQAMLLLAQIFEFEGRLTKAAKTIEAVLAGEPANHVLALRWLELQLAATEGAEQRLAFLDSMCSGKNVSPWVTPAIRAEAAVRMAQIYQGQRQEGLASAAYAKALELDPLLQSALEGQMAITTQDSTSAPADAMHTQPTSAGVASSATSQPSPAQRVQYLLKLITANPVAAHPAWELAALLDSAGLYEQSLMFFEHAQTLNNDRPNHLMPPQDFVVAYCNVLLDAKKPLTALEAYVGLLSLYPQSADLKAMMAEAYLELDQVDRARTIIESLEASYLGEYGTLPAGAASPDAQRPDLLSLSGASSQPAWPGSLWHKLPPAIRQLPAPRPRDVRNHQPTSGPDGDSASSTPAIPALPTERPTASTAPAKTLSAQGAAQLAWFYLMTKRDTQQALAYANAAADAAKDDTYINRIVAAARLAADDKDSQAKKTLQQLSDKDIYATAILAAFYYSHDQDRAGKEALLSGVARTHGGPAFRMLRSIAAEHALQFGPPSCAAEISAIMHRFDDHILTMGSHPQRFLHVTLTAPQRDTTSADPLEVEATIANRGDLPVPIGNWGLLKPIMNLQVTVSDTLRPSDSQIFTRLPAVNWPAPRFLQPGQRFTCKVRLDIGEFADFLGRHPLSEFQLVVAPTLDPFFEGDRMYSSLPGVRCEPVTFTHGDMLGQFDRDNDPYWNEAYRKLLGTIVRDSIKGGDEAARISGAVKTGALLAAARDIETGHKYLPRQLQGAVAGKPAVTKPELLTMLRETLKDSSPLVRAHMVASLQYVALDASIVKQLAPVIEDSSPLVRFEVAQVLGCSGLMGQEPVLTFLAKDPDELVRNMAKTMLLIKPAPAK